MNLSEQVSKYQTRNPWNAGLPVSQSTLPPELATSLIGLTAFPDAASDFALRRAGLWLELRGVGTARRVYLHDRGVCRVQLSFRQYDSEEARLRFYEDGPWLVRAQLAMLLLGALRRLHTEMQKLRAPGWESSWEYSVSQLPDIFLAALDAAMLEIDGVNRIPAGIEGRIAALAVVHSGTVAEQ